MIKNSANLKISQNNKIYNNNIKRMRKKISVL